MSDGQVLHFFGGKGGAGKTTLSTAFALELSDEQGKDRVLLVSVEPNGGLSNLVKKKLTDKPTKLQTIDMTRPGQRDHITIALAIGFEYEDPQISLQVADEYLSQIIGDDMRTRTQRAMETTNFLAREVKRLEAELGATNDVMQLGSLTVAVPIPIAVARFVNLTGL